MEEKMYHFMSTSTGTYKRDNTEKR